MAFGLRRLERDRRARRVHAGVERAAPSVACRSCRGSSGRATASTPPRSRSGSRPAAPPRRRRRGPRSPLPRAARRARPAPVSPRPGLARPSRRCHETMTYNATAMQDLVRQILAELGEDPDREGLAGDAAARREVAQVPDQRLRGRHRRAHQPGALHGRLQRDGHRQGHRFLQPLRAPPAAVLRQVPRRLSAADEGDRPQQDPAHRRRLQPPPAGAGAAHQRDREHHSGRRRSARRRASSWRARTSAWRCAASRSSNRRP